MKKFGLFAAAVAVLTVLLSALASRYVGATADASRVAETAAPRYARTETNASARAVAALAGRRLAGQANELALLRQTLVAEPPVWASDPEAIDDPPEVDLAPMLAAVRALAADALERHARGDHAVAWDDLHASWNLARALLARPELTAVYAGIAATRVGNAAAAQLPPPAPAWRQELASFDYRGAYLAALAFEVTREWRYRERYPAGEPDENRHENALRRAAAPVVRPWVRYRAATRVLEARELLAQLERSRECAPPWLGPRAHEGLNVGAEWMRVARLRAEVEGVERLLALKAGRRIAAPSSCSDGQWIYRRNGNGSTTLAFSRKIPPQGAGASLEWVVR